MAAPVMRDAPVTMRRQKKHLVLKRISAQRPAMTENHRLSAAPVLVIDLRAVFGGDCRHGRSPQFTLAARHLAKLRRRYPSSGRASTNWTLGGERSPTKEG